MDLGANLYEWTVETAGIEQRVRHGGVYNYAYSASARTNLYPCTPNFDTGSRLALYIK